jgi:hypothetical protein
MATTIEAESEVREEGALEQRDAIRAACLDRCAEMDCGSYDFGPQLSRREWAVMFVIAVLSVIGIYLVYLL